MSAEMRSAELDLVTLRKPLRTSALRTKIQEVFQISIFV